MRFADIIGLEEIKDSLRTAVSNNHVAHAQLFHGAPGSATLPLVLAYVAYINCENRTEEDSCGKCPSCIKIDKLIHPDLHMVFPVSATKKLTGTDVVSRNFLKEWRTFLLENPFGTLEDWTNKYGAENRQVNISKEESRNIIKSLALKPFEAQFKVMLIWLPEFMHTAAANAILKILEEPTERTLFFLVSADYEKLLPTILSRVQFFNVRPFSDEEVAQSLINDHQVEPAKAHQIAKLAMGRMSEARNLLEKVEDDSHKMFRDWMRICYGFVKNLPDLVAWSDSYAQLSKTAQKSLLLYGLHLLREALLCSVDTEALVAGNEDELSFVKKFGKAIGSEKISRITELMNEAHYHLERNANAKIMSLDLSLQIGRIIKE